MIANQLFEQNQVETLIGENRVMVLTAHIDVLKRLPKGNWIGATSPYFYVQGQKGLMNNDKIFVTDFTPYAKEFNIKSYDKELITTVAENGYKNGFNFLILPSQADITASFSQHSMSYPNVFDNPLVGLVAGAELEEWQEARNIRVFNGQTGASFDDSGVVLHVALDEGQAARLEIINVFEPNEDIVIEVEEDGPVVKDCLINGKQGNLYDFLKERDLLTISTPFVCNLSGAKINFSPITFDESERTVMFASSLVAGEKFLRAHPLSNYPVAFKDAIESIPEDKDDLIFSCNCLYNYLFGDMEEHDLGVSGAVSFGEIGYRLLNQTFTYLVIDK